MLVDCPDQAAATLILAHGAGAPMDSDFMNALTAELIGKGVAVVRFEFPYMAQRREDGKKRPPNRQPILLECFEQVVEEVARKTDLPKPLIVGGKSMGGRMASLLAAEGCSLVDGVCCFGYPFYPPGKPEKLLVRTGHLRDIKTPVSIFQGTRDPFGKPEMLADMQYSESVKIHWLKDGDHDLKPRKASGLTQAEHLREVAEQVSEFCQSL